jgi:PAS domain S-box-containing protein
MEKLNDKIKEQFQHTLKSYLSDQDGESLSEVYELGRDAIDNGVGVLELLEVCQTALNEKPLQALDKSTKANLNFVFEFLSECMAPYEMKEKGYEELIQKLKVQNKRLKNEIKQREETKLNLRKNKKHFQQLIENALDIITVLDNEGTIRYQSPSIENILGYTADDLIGRSAFDFIHESDWKQVREKLQNISEEYGNEISVKFKFHHKDGNICHLKSNARYVSDVFGKPGIIVNSRDVTEQVKAFDKLENSREQLKKAQKIALLGSWEWNIRQRELHWSGELCDIYGISSEDQPETYKEFLELIPEDSREQLIKLIRKKYRQRDDFEFEHRIILPDGDEKIILARGDVVTNENGAPVKMIGTGQDITKIKKTENKLRAYSNQLKELTEKKERIREKERIRIARKLHDELGQMLTVLKMDLYLLQQKADGKAREWRTESETRQEFESSNLITELKSAIERVDTITGSVRRISTELRPPILDDLGLMEAIAWQLNEFQKRTGICTEFKNRTQTVSDLSNDESTAIFRIFQEALTNIMRHAEANQVSVELSEEKANIILKVQDDGTGIEWDKVNKTKSLGILGMRERSEFLNGDISFLNKEEKGTTVILTIPRIEHRSRITSDQKT